MVEKIVEQTEIRKVNVKPRRCERNRIHELPRRSYGRGSLVNLVPSVEKGLS